MSVITTWLLAHGLSLQLLTLIAFIPVLATLVSISRYLLGLKTLGIYASMVLAFSYYFTGLKFGLIITVIVAIAAFINYYLLNKVRMHYISRVAMNYVIITMLVLAVLVGIYFLPKEMTVLKTQALNPLGLISIAALSDFFIKNSI